MEWIALIGGSAAVCLMTKYGFNLIGVAIALVLFTYGIVVIDAVYGD